MQRKMADNTISLATRIKLNNGLTMPQIHLGVYLMSGSEASSAVGHALDAGYRAFDSAQMYHNEKQVGTAISKYLEQHPDLKREDIHYTTKLASNSDYDQARKSITKSVKECGLGYIDLFLLHSPYGGKKKRLESWRAVEDAIDEGEVRIGGVSNFGEKHVSLCGNSHIANTDIVDPDRRITFKQPQDKTSGQPDRGTPFQHSLQAYGALSEERHRSRGICSASSSFTNEASEDCRAVEEVRLQSRPAACTMECSAWLCAAPEEH